MSVALNGVKILDLTRVLAGPYCTMILADLGAEVIKVEPPNGSDETRSWGPPFKNGVSAYYLCANRNKKAITVNLKSDKGKEIIKELIRESDVVINNFKTGTMERLGLSYNTLSEINPGIIYCSITGFGETGPYKDLAGYDYIIQAMSGLMSITGSQESGPQKVGVAIADILTGLYACIGIQGALFEKQQSGMGQKLDISLFDSSISALVNIASNYLISNVVPKPLGNLHANIVPYQTFHTQDGQIVIAVGNDRQFKTMCSFIGLNELVGDERFSTNAKRVKNREVLTPMIQEKLNREKSSHWKKLCDQNGIPCGPINNIEQLFEDPQVHERNMLIHMQHPEAGEIRVVGSPLKLSRTPVEIRQHPPIHGEHTLEVLLELGYNVEEIEDLKDNEVI